MILLTLLLTLMQQGKPPEARCIGPLPLGCVWQLEEACVDRAEDAYDKCMQECAADGHNPITCNIHCLGGLNQMLSECYCETVCPEQSYSYLPGDIFMKTLASTSGGSGAWQPSGDAHASGNCVGPLPEGCKWVYESQCEIDAQNTYLKCFNKCMWYGPASSVTCEEFCMWDFWEALEKCDCEMECDE